jgi:hypothetical protein
MAIKYLWKRPCILNNVLLGHSWMTRKSSTNKQQIVTKNIKMMLQHHFDHSLEKDGCSPCHVSSYLKIKKQQKRVVVLGYIDDWSPILLLELVDY